MPAEYAILIAFFALLGNAFFVGAEFGLVSARRSSVESLAAAGSKKAKKTLYAMEHISLMLAGAQLGITLFSLVLGAVAEPVIAHALESPLHALGLSDASIHIVSFIIALTIMVYLHVVVGEMIPKNLALARPEQTALKLVPWLVLIVSWIKPVVFGLNWVANKTLVFVKIQPKDEIPSAFNRDEVAGFIKESHNEGYIDKDEAELLSSALNLDDAILHRIILPYKDLVTIPLESTYVYVKQLASKYGYSRYPIKDGDKYIGYVHLKDIIAVKESNLNLNIDKSIIRDLYPTTEDQSLRIVLTGMQKARSHLGQVFSTKGEPIGLIALEDVLEELVGTIHDYSHS
ncbi:MAG: magnesium and cobalt exporter, family [Patescibacteria group bacterium]|nr:magnesium and cobalt exporter, family [Patescibacteria group bacterium]